MWTNWRTNLKYRALDSIITIINWKKAKDTRLFGRYVRLKWTVERETQSIVKRRKVNWVSFK